MIFFLLYDGIFLIYVGIFVLWYDNLLLLWGNRGIVIDCNGNFFLSY